MRRFLLFLVIFGAVVLLLRRLSGLFAGGPAREARSDEPARSATRMVRDRVCNTFLPREKALSLVSSGQTHYFCSEECRSRYLAGGSTGGGVARMAV
ncbi:MAG TPA: hypothetical protein VFP98_03750 [Candidatus Polarisedimenticolia bacterium]|nr:hypothetical protein [Candidatus Polarisedimenticolia bacterium]